MSKNNSFLIYFTYPGSFGVYVPLDGRDRGIFEFYSKLGFIEITNHGPEGEKPPQVMYVGRSF